MARLEAVANVALRVPGLALLDLLYRWDAAAIGELLRPRRGDPQLLRAPALRAAHCLGHLLCVVVLVLPVRSLVKLYLHLLTGLLLGVGHTVARDFVRQELEYGFQGAVYSDPVALSSFATTLASQLCLCALCSLLMRSRQPWLFGAPLLPVLARLCGLPLHVLPVLNTFAATLTAMEVLYILGSHILVPFQLAAAACREIAQAVEVYRLVALGMSLWSQLAIPLLFLVFWLVLFFLQLSSFLASSSSPLAQQGLLFLLLSSAAECCGTPYSLIGLTFTVSYLALGVLNLCKFYLLGFGAFQNGNVMHRGVTEGVTLLLLALQTGLLDLQILQRTFLLSIILFIVVTSTLQSMIEIADPIVLALGASRNRSPWKHFRGVSMCLFLLVFPCFMAYKIAHFFHLDFWLLILVSSCMLTSLQAPSCCLPGDGHPLHLRPFHGGAAPGHAAGADGRDHLLCECSEPSAGVPGGRLCGGLRHLGVPLRGVELDGRLRHHHPLLLQRLAARSVGLEELSAAPRGCQEDQLPAPGHRWAAAGPQRCLCHLLPGHAGGRRHSLQSLLPRCLPPQVALRAGHVPHVPPASHASGCRGGSQHWEGGSASTVWRGRGARGQRSCHEPSPGSAPAGWAAQWGQCGHWPGGQQGDPEQCG
ncbi:RING finger protein 145-like isoform X3 [Falco cherrug]|uniref:RING finger protein 145-like isoform X3 n=1 Tax=Falco cherrug TaxID=345164 RepID=UPI00247B0F52|nr:RING finger protein 145-like isoform X3 [Falco cherrug]